jgi:hypothetical protein
MVWIEGVEGCISLILRLQLNLFHGKDKVSNLSILVSSQEGDSNSCHDCNFSIVCSGRVDDRSTRMGYW